MPPPHYPSSDGGGVGGPSDMAAINFSSASTHPDGPSALTHPDGAGLYPGIESCGGTPWSASERSSFDHDSSGFGGPLSGPLSADSHSHRHFTFNEPLANSSMTSMIHDPGYSSSATPNLGGSQRSFFSQSMQSEEPSEPPENEEFPSRIRKSRRRSNSLTPPSSTPTSPQFQEEWPPFHSQSSTRDDLTASATVTSIARQLSNNINNHVSAATPSTAATNNSSINNSTAHSRCTRSNSFPTETDSEGLTMMRVGSGGASGTSFLSRHAPLSPQSSVASSEGGEMYVAKPIAGGRHTFSEPMSGMKDVPSWLKSLRLHKYAHLFSQLTYEQMLSLNEEQLENQGVTKGARHKICLSISKLGERPGQLRQMEKDIMEGKGLRQAFNDLKLIIASPIKYYERKEKASPSTECVGGRDGRSNGGIADNASSSSAGASSTGVVLENGPSEERKEEKSRSTTADEPKADSSTAPQSPVYENGLPSAVDDMDLPSMITRVLGKACTQLLVSPGRPDEEGIGLYINLLDRTLAHEAFNNTQKKRLNSWKQQVMKIWRPIGVSHRRGELSKTHRPNWPFRHSSTYSSLLSSDPDSMAPLSSPGAPPSTISAGGGSSASPSMSSMTHATTPTGAAAANHLLISTQHHSFYMATPQTAAAFAAAAAAGLPQTNYAAAAAAAALMNRGSSHPLLSMQSGNDNHHHHNNNNIPASRSLGAQTQPQQQQQQHLLQQMTSPSYLAGQIKAGRITGKLPFGPEASSSSPTCSTPEGDLSSIVSGNGDSSWLLNPGETSSQLNRNHSTNGIFMQRQNAFDKTHSVVTRTQSAPGEANPPKEKTVSRPPELTRGVAGGASVSSGKKCPEAIFDINTRLESLALSMTEHALSGPDNADPNAPI